MLCMTVGNRWPLHTVVIDYINFLPPTSFLTNKVFFQAWLLNGCPCFISLGENRLQAAEF